MLHDPFFVGTIVLFFLEMALAVLVNREYLAVAALRPVAFQSGRVLLATKVTLSSDPRQVPLGQAIETPTGKFIFTTRDRGLFTGRIETRRILGIPHVWKSRRLPLKGSINLYGRTAEIEVKSLPWTDFSYVVHFIALPLIFAEGRVFPALVMQAATVVAYVYHLRRIRRDALAIVQEIDANLVGVESPGKMAARKRRLGFFRPFGSARTD